MTAPGAASGVALWRQVADGIERGIADGSFAAGERLPGETDIAETYRVNRHTVRRALATLAERGLVRAERGSGTYVEAPRLAYPLRSRTRFSEIVGAGGVWLVEADAAELEAAVLNLAVNARDAMPDGGKLTVRTANVTSEECAGLTYKGMPPADYVRIDVADTGTGIPADIRDKIFEPFYRASTTTRSSGAGLGLSIVRQIARAHGGTVEYSLRDGGGSRFTVNLPR